jgi:hypothetical protein
VRPVALVAALTLLPFGLAVPAAGDTECRLAAAGVEVCRAPVWFQAPDGPGGTLGNLAGAGVTSYPTWGTEPPSRSVSEGGGAGYASTTAEPLAGSPGNVATFVGTFTGPIESIAVDLYGYNVGGSIDLGHIYHRGHEFRTRSDTEVVLAAWAMESRRGRASVWPRSSPRTSSGTRGTCRTPA